MSLPFQDPQISAVQGFQNSQTNEATSGNNDEALGEQALFPLKDFCSASQGSWHKTQRAGMFSVLAGSGL